MQTNQIASHGASSKDAPPIDIISIKSRFDLFTYAHVVTGCRLSPPDAKGYRKILGGKLGGLTVRPDGFYHHSAGIGGDVLDFIAYMRHGRTCRFLTAREFRDVIVEADRAVTGSIPAPARRASAGTELRRPADAGVRAIRSTSHPSRVDVLTPWRHVETYTYSDEEGRPLYHIDRRERMIRLVGDTGDQAPDGSIRREKTFAMWHTAPDGKRINSLDGCRMVLYMLPDVVSAVREGLPIVIVEGEKDADLANLYFRHEIGGYVATTNAGGAGTWREDYTTTLRQADVILCGDADRAGIEHVHDLALHLRPHVARLRILDLRVLLGFTPASGYTSASTAPMVPASLQHLPLLESSLNGDSDHHRTGGHHGLQ